MMPSCFRKTIQAFRITKALITRVLFGLHGVVCVWRVVVAKQQPWFWGLVSSLVLLGAETVFTLKTKKGGEWKWFCPSVFLYLAGTLPAIWFLELDLLERRIHEKAMETNKDTAESVQPDLSLVLGEISFHLPLEDWVKILEQVLLLVLIIGRWLLPKGQITREQLSQLLLVYIGMAADIIELFEAFKEDEVKFNRQLTIIILSLWTASLLQFCFVMSAAKARKSRPSFTKQASRSSLGNSGRCFTCRSEIVSIMTTIVLQDGSFLVLRMMLIFRYNVVSYTNIFFTAKNTLVNVLQLYRLVVLYAESVKLIKRQKSDPMFDEMFLIKAGILVNQIAAREEERRRKKEQCHVGIQTSFQDDDFDGGGDDRGQAAEPADQLLDSFVIENPMNATNDHVDDDACHKPIKGTEKGHPKQTKKRKKSGFEIVGPEILNITMMYLDPLSLSENADFSGDVRKNALNPPRRVSGGQSGLGDVTAQIPSTSANGGNEDGKQYLTDISTRQGRRQSEIVGKPNDAASKYRQKFKGVVHEVINNRFERLHTGQSVITDDIITSSEDPLADNTDTCNSDSLALGDVETENLRSSPGDLSDISPNAIEGVGSCFKSDICAPRKKARWRWRRATKKNRKDPSDLNQNSAEGIHCEI